jgi:hypothetical protein
MTEKVSSTGPKEPDKNKKKSTPDSDEFKKHIEKAKEAEFEGKRKRKYEKEHEKDSVEGSKSTDAPPSLPSPDEAYQSSQSKGAYFDDDENYSTSMDETHNQAASKTDQKKHKKKEEITPFKKDEKISSKTLKEEEKLKLKEEKENKLKIKEEKPTVKQEKEKQNLKEEKPFEVSKEKIHPSSMPAVLQEFSKEVGLTAHSLTANLSPYLPSDVTPLFQKMVGTIIHIEQQGITKTEVILDSKAFENSIFYGSSISLEQYSTAPNSYNIILKGPNQAVSMFNENLDGLYNSFKKGDFSFKINRLEAEYERPLFKRKEKTSSSDTDLGEK